jgi:hypothetical protein
MDGNSIVEQARTVSERAVPPPDYRKKIQRDGDDAPLSDTFTDEQLRRRVAFYEELRAQRERLRRRLDGRHGDSSSEHSAPAKGTVSPAATPASLHRRLALLGHRETTTVRVYMRETVMRLAAELFPYRYALEVRNVRPRSADGSEDKDHGYVLVDVTATEEEIDALLAYLRPGSMYHVYDGERRKYVKGDTEASEFVITRPEDRQQPQHYWRRSTSFIAAVAELPVDREPPEASTPKQGRDNPTSDPGQPKPDLGEEA